METILWDANPFRKKLWMAGFLLARENVKQCFCILGIKQQKMSFPNMEDEVKLNGGF